MSLVIGCALSICVALWLGLSLARHVGLGLESGPPNHFRRQTALGVQHFSVTFTGRSTTDWERATPKRAFTWFCQATYAPTPPTVGYMRPPMDHYEGPAAAAVAWGWPCPSLVSYRYYPTQSLEDFWEICGGRAPMPLARAIPVTPIWSGLALNSVLFSFPVIAAVHLAGGLRWTSRRVRGHCGRCGYDLRRSAVDSCPECGTRPRTAGGRSHGVLTAALKARQHQHHSG